MGKIYDASTSDGKHEILKAYIQAAELSRGLSFKSFCEQIGLSSLDYKQVLYWSGDHGYSIKGIRYGDNSSSVSEGPTFIQVRPRMQSVFPVLGKVSINFPDGINLTLQEAGIEQVITLLDTYKSRHNVEGGASLCSL